MDKTMLKASTAELSALLKSDLSRISEENLARVVNTIGLPIAGGLDEIKQFLVENLATMGAEGAESGVTRMLATIMSEVQAGRTLSEESTEALKAMIIDLVAEAKIVNEQREQGTPQPPPPPTTPFTGNQSSSTFSPSPDTPGAVVFSPPEIEETRPRDGSRLSRRTDNFLESPDRPTGPPTERERRRLERQSSSSTETFGLRQRRKPLVREMI